MSGKQRKCGVCITCALVFVAVLVVSLAVTFEPAHLSAKQPAESAVSNQTVPVNDGEVDAASSVNAGSEAAVDTNSEADASSETTAHAGHGA